MQHERTGHKMKKLLLFLLFFSFIFIFTSCYDDSADEVALPPLRIVENPSVTVHFSEAVHTFEDAFKMSDAIAHIKITGYKSSEDCFSYHDAELIHLYKGTLPKEFILMQDGSPQYTWDPLFINGNEMLLFLCEYAYSGSYDIVYSILGGSNTIIDAVNVDSENIYYTPRSNSFAESFELSSIETAKKEILEKLSSQDPYISVEHRNYIFSKNDLENLIYNQQ